MGGLRSVLVGGWCATSALAELVIPRTCAVCGAPGHAGSPCCRACHVELVRASALPVVVAGRTGRAVGPEGAVVVSGSYEGVLRRAVVAFKDGDRRDLLPVLVPPLRAALATALTRRAVPASHAVAVVPAPSSRRATRRRGDVPIHLLARAAISEMSALGGPPVVWAPVLRHVRGVADQAALSRAERVENTRGAFEVGSGLAVLRDRDVVIVDDVVTTGSTVAECVRALRAAGARPVGVAALAATLTPKPRS